MFDDKLDFENDANITSTQQEILQLDGIYQGVMAGQGAGYTEDEVLDKMEKAAQSIGWTLEDAMEYAEEVKINEEIMFGVWWNIETY